MRPSRRLTERDVDSFLTATGKRPPEKHLLSLDQALKRENPVRWWRMKRDFKWAKKQAKKMGYDPEEIRWLL